MNYINLSYWKIKKNNYLYLIINLSLCAILTTSLATLAILNFLIEKNNRLQFTLNSIIVLNKKHNKKPQEERKLSHTLLLKLNKIDKNQLFNEKLMRLIKHALQQTSETTIHFNESRLVISGKNKNKKTLLTAKESLQKSTIISDYSSETCKKNEETLYKFFADVTR